jgi:dihydroorotase/N-acyl-D-amino-acid deacylase
MYRRSFAGVLLLASCAIAITAPTVGAEEPPLDVLISNGRVVDGSGSPWFAADVGIRGGRIAAIGRLGGAAARERIDARGQVIAPGFIDMLGQSDLSILVDPRLPSKIFQGITTEITGEGITVAPLPRGVVTGLQPRLANLHIEADWQDFAGYFARLERQGIGINLGSYVGATTIREVVVGKDDRVPTPTELEQMRRLVRVAMAQGAMGVSSALAYAPAPYARTEELIALASAAAESGGIHATHMRSYGDEMDAALEETFRIAREARIPTEILHMEIAGKRNWGRMGEVVAKIEAARASGLDIATDTHAYLAWWNYMSAFVPPWAHEGGDAKLVERLRDPATRARIRSDIETSNSGWENEWLEISGPEAILIDGVANPRLRPLQGQTIAAIAAARAQDPLDTLLDILAEDNAFTLCSVFGFREDDVVLALIQPWTSIGVDAAGTAPEGALSRGHPHPRAYGTFPRVLRMYVREQPRLTLEEAIRKFSALPAGRMGLADRGLLKAGLAADVVIFDPETITDRSTYEAPHQLASGMQWVFVNGVAVIAEGRMTGALPGKVLRGPGYRAVAQ